MKKVYVNNTAQIKEPIPGTGYTLSDFKPLKQDTNETIRK